MESKEVLKAREEEIGREWERLHHVINRVDCKPETATCRPSGSSRSNAASSASAAWKR